MLIEKKWKDFDSKLMFSLKSSSKEKMSTWEITKMISELSVTFYKEDLINTISIAFKENIDPKNIFIMSKSFSSDIKYSYLKDKNILDLNLSDEIKNLYHLGKPMSLAPNIKIEGLNICFEYFREMNREFKKIARRTINKDLLSEIKELCFEKKSIEAIELIYNNYKNILNSLDMPEEINTSIMEKLYKKAKKQMEKFNKLSLEINTKNEKTGSNSLDKHLKSFYTKFFDRLKSTKRPVIGILHEETNCVQILCTEYIIKSKKENRALDLKEISHNSPTTLIFIGGVIVAPAMLSLLENHMNHKQNIKKKTYIEELELQNKIKAELKEKMKKEEFKAIEEIKENYFKASLKFIKKNINDKTIKILKKFDFNNDNLKFKEIDNKAE